MKTFTSLKEIVADPENVYKVQLRKRRFQTIPLEIDRLPNLYHLDLRQNAIISIPDEFYFLRNILELNLSENKLGVLSSEIYNLLQLQRLDVRDNLLTEIPSEIGKLSQLVELHIDNNKLESLPVEICLLSKLQEFTISSNNLYSLPEEIGTLNSLSIFDLSQNNLTHIPESIGAISTLAILNVSQNPLIELPISLQKSSTLHTLNLSSCHSLFTSETLDLLGRIPTLQKLSILNVTIDNWSEFFTKLSKNATLQSIELSIETLPAEAALLTNKEIEFHFVNDVNKSIKKAHFQIRKFNENEIESRWRLILFSLYLEKTNDAVAYAKELFTIEELFDFLDHPIIEVRNVGIMALSEIFGNPFMDNFHPRGSVFYITGRFREVDIEEGKQKLKDYDVKISRELDATVQYIVAGFGSGKEAFQSHINGYIIAFEPHLDWLLPHLEKSFLEQNSQARISDNLKRLLFDADHANVKIALNTIDSCGCSADIMGIVLSISCFHERASLRKKATAILQKYTPKIFVQQFYSIWKNSFREHFEEKEIITLMFSNFKTEEVFHFSTFFDTSYRLTNSFQEIVLALGADSFTEVASNYCKGNTLSTQYAQLWTPKGFQRLASFKGITHLDFTNSNLRFLLPEIGLVTQLECLTLKQNALQTLPKEIGNLKNLQELNIYKNRLVKLPQELGNLKKLSQLFLSNNQLTFLPVELLQLTQLSQISLWGNKFDYYEKEKIKNMFPSIVISF